MSLNQKVVNYAQSNIGKRVVASIAGAKGECWDLAYEALKSAGATKPKSIYVWSTQVVDAASAVAGDILQFHLYKVKVSVDNEDGSGWDDIIELGVEGAPRHTSILKSKGSKGDVEVYEQNMAGVVTTQVNTWQLIPGTYQNGKQKITIKHVSGSMTIYRPKK